jgi:hypothetical protein
VWEPTHKLHRKNGYVLESVKIVEEFLERGLRRDERVAHKDGDRGNNDIMNLRLEKKYGGGLVWEWGMKIR